MKRAIALALALGLTLSAAACGSPAGGDASSGTEAVLSHQQLVARETIGSARIPYQSDDTLNPYTCQTLQNYYIAGLLYDTLVALDENYQPQNRLAQEVSLQDGTRVEIHLRGNAVFSDGSVVTAADVAASLELARNTLRFSPGLQGIQSVEIPTDATVIITLASPDVFFLRSLCFPIFKAGTQDQPQPVGGGRYLLDSSDGLTLTANSRYHTPAENVKTIELVASSSLEDQSYSLLAGEIDLMYSDLQGDLNLGLGVGYRQVSMNNLVYLGVNSGRWGMDQELRSVLSSLINRDDILRKAYLGFGSASASLLNPAYASVSLDSAQLDIHLDKINARLDELGYAARDDMGYRTAGGRRLSLSLLVNRDNASREAAAQLIASSCALAGIEVTVVRAEWAAYTAAIASGEYDLYIGEVKIPYNMDISGLLSPNETFGAGIPSDPEVDEAYARAKAGEITAEELDRLLREKLPVIPLLYRRGILCFARDFSVNMVATEQDIFYNIVDW